jgi:glucosylceramidase
MMGHLLRLALLSALPLAAAANDIDLIQTSSAGDTWAPLPPLSWGADFLSAMTCTVNAQASAQTIMGFGAAFTDTSAFNAVVLAQAAVQDAFFEAMWGETGLGLTIGRVTINSADYSLLSYNFDNVTDDFNLTSFDNTLAYDQQHVMPMIRRAQATLGRWGADELRLFGSPWSPPGWMKVNGNMINSALPCLKNDTAAGDSYKATWAEYIMAWLQAYESHGLPMWGLTPQNEPMAQQASFESCAYELDGMVDFIATYLGPRVKAAFPNLALMVYDHNRLAALDWVTAIYASSSAIVDGAALHWYDYGDSLGLYNIAAIRALAPSKFILNTEACYLQSLVLDWRVSALYMADIIGGLNAGLNGWVAWNHLLLTGDKFPWARGGPNHDNTTSFGDTVLLEFNASGTQRLIFQPPYFIVGHVSRFARRGAVLVSSGGPGFASDSADWEAVRAYAIGKGAGPESGLKLLAVAFRSADGKSISVVVANPNDGPALSFKLADGTGRAAAASIPGKAIQTYTWAS